MRDNATGLYYCPTHSTYMASLKGAALSSCPACGFRYSNEHSTFYNGPGSHCPSCGQAMSENVAPVGSIEAPILRALKEWMDKAPPGNASDLVAELDNIGDPKREVYGGWGVDWGAGIQVEILEVLSECLKSDLTEGPNKVELRGVVEGDELDGIPVWSPRPTPKEFDRSLLQIVAGRYVHYVAKLDPELFALLVHQGEIATRFQGTGKSKALELVPE